MDHERFSRTLCALSDIFGSTIRPDGSNPKWFISFGSLLWFIRDRLLGREFEQDIDISMIYGAVDRNEIVGRFAEYGFTVDHELVDNHYHKPLQIVFKPTNPILANIHIDLWFWVIAGQYAWHSYDPLGQGRTILPSYTFKGTPKDLILAETISYPWEEIAPPMNFPTMYGSLLDTWYPPVKGPDGRYVPNTGWLFPNRQYGQSRCPVTKTVQSCKEMIG